MERVPTGLMAVGGGGFRAFRCSARPAAQGTAREDLEGVRRLADGEVTLLREQLWVLLKECDPAR
jgi:hypothetical protein